MKKDPPCKKCMVEPLSENEDALRVFYLVKNQFIMGNQGPIDLNHLAIDAAIKREGISNSCFNKVLILGQWWLDRISNAR